LDKREVESGLLKKGFQQDEGNHHYFIYFTANGKKTPVKTKTSHGKGKYKRLHASLLSQMARQCYLTKQGFEDLINCPLTREAYENHLIEKGHV
jgi:hypothetical protein